jgi:hypothetical protein
MLFDEIRNVWEEIAESNSTENQTKFVTKNIEKPYPIMKGTMTPTVPVTKEAEPTVRNSLKVISKPATNKKVYLLSLQRREQNRYIVLLESHLLQSLTLRHRVPAKCLQRAHPKLRATLISRKVRLRLSLKKPKCICLR